MSTPTEHYEAMEKLAESIQAHSYVKEARIDDFGRFSNFSLIVVPHLWERATTNKLKAIVKQALKETPAHLRDYFPPEFRGHDFLGRRQYHRSFWMFDIDYHGFNPEQNVFFDKENQKVLCD